MSRYTMLAAVVGVLLTACDRAPTAPLPPFTPAATPAATAFSIRGVLHVEPAADSVSAPVFTLLTADGVTYSLTGAQTPNASLDGQTMLVWGKLNAENANELEVSEYQIVADGGGFSDACGGRLIVIVDNPPECQLRANRTAKR